MYLKHISDLERSRFLNWSKAEIVELLVAQGIELRNEESLDLLPLRDLADNLFTGRNMPPKPDLPTVHILVLANVMARRIQTKWISYLSAKRMVQEEQRLSILQQDEDINFEIALIDAFDINEAYNSNSDDSVSPTSTPRDIRLDVDLESHITDPSNSSSDMVTDTAVRRRRRAHRRDEARMKKKINILDVPWEKPKAEAAVKYMDYVQPRRGGKGGSLFDFQKTSTGRFCFLGGLGEQLDLWEEGQVSEFGIYGPGITNYFKFLKFLFWLLTILTVISMPLLVLNVYGPYSSTAGLSQLSLTTVGHLTPANSNSSVSVHIPGCTDYGLYELQCTLNSGSLAQFYSITDIIICCTILIAYFWLKYFENVEEKSLDSNTVNASMFTIMVSGLPVDVTEEEVIEHFNSLIKTSYHRQSVTILGSSNMDYSIAAVSFAFNNVEEIDECINRGDIIRAKIRLVHEHRYHITKLLSKNHPDTDKLIADARTTLFAKMKQKNVDLKQKQDLLEAYSTRPADVIYAFVTFNKVSAKDTVMYMYQRSNYCLNWLWHDDKLTIRGHKLKIVNAPEPSTIIWENLSFSWNSRMGRRSMTTFLSLFLILFSLVTIFCSKYFSETSGSNNSSSSSLCPSNFNSLTDKQQQEYVAQNNDQVHCYCDQFGTIEQSQKSVCQSYLQKSIYAQILQYFAAFVVIVVNLLLENAMKYFVLYEKHQTEDSKGESVFFRLFALKYVNTAAVFFINGDNVILLEVFGLSLPNKYDLEFSSNWFNTIGVTIILVQLSDAFFSHAGKVWIYLQYHYTLKFVKSEAGESLALTQDELNKLYSGCDCELAYNYAQIMSTLFVCLTFSTGIPVLYCVAAGNFLLFYFVEKYLFIRFYKAPPHLTSNIGKSATSMIPFAVALHLAMSIWVLSNKELFDSGTSTSTSQLVLSNSAVDAATNHTTLRDRIIGTHTFPLFLLMCAVLLFMFIKFLVQRLTISAEEYWSRFLCWTSNRKSQSGLGKAQYMVSYTRAVQRNLIKGLSTYNLLQNPLYKEAFSITWKFAVANKTVRSVRTLKSKAQYSADEVDAEKVERLQRTSILEESSHMGPVPHHHSSTKPHTHTHRVDTLLWPSAIWLT